MPVRKIPIGNRAVTGRHGRSGARYESSLERDFFELMMADPAVASVEEQPVRLDYTASNGMKRHYTPDALVTFHPNSCFGTAAMPLLCEIKYRDEYRERFSELKERLKVARRYAREKGWRFRVFTDREIRSTRLKNVRFLAGFRERAAFAGEDHLLLENLKSVGATTPAALLGILTADENSIFEGIVRAAPSPNFSAYVFFPMYKG